VREIGLEMGSKNNLQTNIDCLCGWVATIAMEKSNKEAMEEGVRLWNQEEKNKEMPRKDAIACKNRSSLVLLPLWLIYEIHKP